MIEPTHTRIAVEFKAGSPLVGCRFDSSGRYLFAGAQDNTIRRFDLVTGAAATLSGHASWVRGMTFVGKSPTIAASLRGMGSFAGSVATSVIAAKAAPTTLVSGDYQGSVRWWDASAETPKPTRTVAAHDGWVRAVATSPDEKHVASCGNDGLVKLWSVANGSPIRTFEGHGCHVYNVAFHPTGKTLFSCDLKGVVKEWDVATGKHVRDLDAKILHKYDSGFAADIGGARGMTVSADGSTLACVGITNVSNAFAGVGNPLVVLFDLKDGKARQLKPKDAFQGTGWGVGFLSTGWVIAAGGGGQGRVWFWKPNEVTDSHVVTVPANARDLALHPDGTAFAVAGANGTAYVYTMTPGPMPPPKAAPKKK
jgi:WD40 repeat protein